MFVNFAATIIKGSPIDRLWRGQRRLSGDIHGVRFRLAGTLNAGIYCAREVTADRVHELQHNQSVQLEAMSVAPPEPAPVEEPEEAPPVGDPEESNADDGVETDSAAGAAAQPVPGAPAAPRRRGRPPKSAAPAQE